MVNIGTRPTFDDGARTIEANLLDFDDDLYGMLLTLHFVDYLRPEQRFGGVTALVAQLQLDRAATDKMKMLGFHWPYPGLGFAERKGTAYRYVAAT